MGKFNQMPTVLEMKFAILILCLSAVFSTGHAARVVCYFTNWSRFATEPFGVESVNATLCTHVVYSFFGLTDNGEVRSVDPWNDFGDEWTEGSIKKFQKLRSQNPSVKLLLGVGGWNEGAVRFTSMVRSPEKRKQFLASTTGFIQQLKLDGLEIDWVYQDSWGGTQQDKQGYSELLSEMKPRYAQLGYLLGIATSANPTVFANSYEISKLSKNVDYINLMTYDYHGSWDRKTGHVAPLYPGKAEKNLNVEATVDKYLKAGASPEKLNLGLVAYGRSFTLVDPNVNGFDAPSSGPGILDPFPYRTFCLEQKKWKKFRNEEEGVPYAVAGNQWLGYEDVRSLADKVKFAKSKKLGGVSFWSLDYDDFKGSCGSGKFPLLNSVKKEISKR